MLPAYRLRDPALTFPFLWLTTAAGAQWLDALVHRVSWGLCGVEAIHAGGARHSYRCKPAGAGRTYSMAHSFALCASLALHGDLAPPKQRTSSVSWALWRCILDYLALSKQTWRCPVLS
jgi:hypothetical protein